MLIPMPEPFTFPARVLRVIDGDTIDVELDRGWGDTSKRRLRLLGVDAPEVHGASKPAGLVATAYTADWLRDTAEKEWPYRILSVSLDDFGRILGHLWRVSDGRHLNEDLIAAHQAVVYREAA